ncbi:hypothetical protein [Cupriavidus sp. 2SB]|uniref:hypothetical protein n=1 Tax=Cupriavidus sp. 2SB TaxID=2502199 RepID=UPI0010F94757|nr:hypothetical protein [Cupriavidus sp. 2SB]
MRLTKAQLAHACMRLNQAAEKRIAEAVPHIGPKPALPGISFAEQCDQIRTGKAKLRPQGELNSYTDLKDAYTYPAHDKAVTVAKKAIATWEAAHRKITERVHAERDRVLDKIMLSDAEDALAHIDAFSGAKG